MLPTPVSYRAQSAKENNKRDGWALMKGLGDDCQVYGPAVYEALNDVPGAQSIYYHPILETRILRTRGVQYHPHAPTTNQ